MPGIARRIRLANGQIPPGSGPATARSLVCVPPMRNSGKPAVGGVSPGGRRPEACRRVGGGRAGGGRPEAGRWWAVCRRAAGGGWAGDGRKRAGGWAAGGRAAAGGPAGGRPEAGRWSAAYPRSSGMATAVRTKRANQACERPLRTGQPSLRGPLPSVRHRPSHEPGAAAPARPATPARPIHRPIHCSLTRSRRADYTQPGSRPANDPGRRRARPTSVGGFLLEWRPDPVHAAPCAP